MYASGTTILHASSSIQYLSMPFNKDIVDKFTETISPIVDKIITNKIENIKLAEMRDLLLPKLMSGEIRLPIEE
jgi:type I restriction enzyme S subunit